MSNSNDNEYYVFLGVERTATDAEIKSAYRRLALRYHPDKVTDEQQRSDATERFQRLNKIYSVLSDQRLRQIYDQTGSVEETTTQQGEGDWAAYFRELHLPVTKDAIAAYERKYIGSDEELEDLKLAYEEGKGSMDYIMEHVPFAEPEQEERYRERLQPLIDAGALTNHRAFRPNAAAAKRRKQQAAAEAKEAEQMAKEQGIGSEADLQKLIQQRGKQRHDSLIASLEAKYANPPKKRGKKDADSDHNEPSAGSSSSSSASPTKRATRSRK